MDREKVIKGLGIVSRMLNEMGRRNEMDIVDDAIALLKDETTCINKSRLFHCEKCGYGIDDIFLSDEHNYQIDPRFCPNCGRFVKWQL